MTSSFCKVLLLFCGGYSLGCIEEMLNVISKIILGLLPKKMSWSILVFSIYQSQLIAMKQTCLPLPSRYIFRGNNTDFIFQLLMECFDKEPQHLYCCFIGGGGRCVRFKRYKLPKRTIVWESVPFNIPSCIFNVNHALFRI